MCDAVVDLSTLEKTGLFGRPSGHVELLEVNDGTRVAIKKIKVRPLTEEDILKELNHENVIKLLDIKWKDDSKYEKCYVLKTLLLTFVSLKKVSYFGILRAKTSGLLR